MTSQSARRRAERNALPSLTTIFEAILFATDRPVTIGELQEAVPGADAEAVRAAMDELAREYAERGMEVQEVAGGYQLVTRAELASYVERFLVGKRKTRLSRAALETLATIAYRQPITRGEIEELRGVDSGHVLQTLMSRDLITIRGRSDALGRPLLYGTTNEFLSYFALTSLNDLPNLEEFEALAGDDPLEDPEIRSTLESHGLLGTPEESGDDAGSVDADDDGRDDGSDPAAQASRETARDGADETEDQDDATPEEEADDAAQSLAPEDEAGGPDAPRLARPAGERDAEDDAEEHSEVQDELGATVASSLEVAGGDAREFDPFDPECDPEEEEEAEDEAERRTSEPDLRGNGQPHA